jgi:hypothetical protein
VREIIAFILLAAVLVFVAVVCQREHETQAFPLIAAEAPRNYPQEHRLFATCPWTPWAVPQAKGVVQT